MQLGSSAQCAPVFFTSTQDWVLTSVVSARTGAASEAAAKAAHRAAKRAFIPLSLKLGKRALHCGMQGLLVLTERRHIGRAAASLSNRRPLVKPRATFAI